MDVVDRARAGDGEAFRELVAPYERELRVHCYRMLGSFHDAEDALQETLLSAWQGLAGFEGRASLRTWLYRVATSRCLDTRRSARRRAVGAVAAEEPPPPEMTGLVPPAPTRLGEVTWLQPYPDDQLGDIADPAPGPDARYAAAESISLAFITAIQLLPPRQRAVLILRDVLGFRASEVAEFLGSTEESVTSALKRARATLERREPGTPEHAAAARAPGTAAERRLVSQLTAAFAAADVPAVVALLTDDAWFTMPPLPLQYQGRRLAGEFLAATAFRPGWTATLVEAPTKANGQPAFGFYARNEQTGHSVTVGLLVLTLADTQDGARITAMTRFTPRILPAFGLDA